MVACISNRRMQKLLNIKMFIKKTKPFNKSPSVKESMTMHTDFAFSKMISFKNRYVFPTKKLSLSTPYNLSTVLFVDFCALLVLQV